MANDLVVNLALDYGQYQQGLQSSIAQNAKFSSSVKVMAAQIKQAQGSIRNSSELQPNSQRMNGGLFAGRVQAKANLSGEQANTRVLSAQMQDSQLQATLLATGLEKLRQEQVQLATSNAQLVASMASVEHQEDALWLSVQRADQAMLQAKSSTRQLSAIHDNSTIQTTNFAIAIEHLQQEQLQLSASNAQLAASTASATYGEESLWVAVQKSDQAMLQAQASVKQLAAAQGSAEIRGNQLATALANEKANALQARAANVLLKDSLQSVTIQKQREQTAFQQGVGAILRDRQAAIDTANSRRGLHRAYREGIITVQEYNNAIKQSNVATAGTAAGTGRAQAAISQLIFAVDDAATVYGTSGLAGAVRAAANNLTQFASLAFGPWGLAIGVAVAAATQLYLAFNKGGEEADKESDKIRDLTSALKEQSDQTEKNIAHRKELRDLREDGSSMGARDALRGRQDDLRSNEIRRDSYNENIDKNNKIISFMSDPAQRNGAYRDPSMMFGGPEGDQKALDTAMAENVEIQKKLNEMRVDDVRLNQEAVDLQKTYNSLLGTESNLRAAERSDALRSLESQGAARNQEIRNENRDSVKQMAQSITDVRNSISDELDPTQKDKQKRAIAEELRERQKVIATIPGTTSERQTLRRQAEESASRKMAELDANPAQGPSGFEQGSKDSADLIRRAMLGAPLQKDKSEEYLAEVKEAMKTLNVTAKEQRDYEKKFLDNQPTPINKL